jgi:dipeptidase
MCDTFVALSNSTENGSVIFGKNSDREPNEAHELVIIPHAYHLEGETVKCTYIDIPQVAETNAVLLAKPFWIWGAEMGANEHNVVIGNEAIFSKIPAGKKPGLIGMDFLRLALERANTAFDALKVITDLLEEYGQSGNCGFAHKLFYHNSYLIADSNQAWVLETVDRHWAAEKVNDVRSISNGLTIENKWDLASKDLVACAINKGWCKNEHDFNFRKCYSDFLYTRFSDSDNRVCRTREFLNVHNGNISVQKAMSLLRDHGDESNAAYSPGRGITGAQVCMHASMGPIRGSQSTGSMITEIQGNHAIHWLTGTSAPCTSTFKPVWLDAGIPQLSPTVVASLHDESKSIGDERISPSGTYDQTSLWWKHEDLHREVLRDHSLLLREFKADRNALEAEFMDIVSKRGFLTRKSKLDFSQACFDVAWQSESEWLERIKPIKAVNRRRLIHEWAWNSFDRQAKRK